MLWSIVALMLLLLGVAISGMTARSEWLVAVSCLALVGFLISWASDRKEGGTYVVEGTQLLMKRKYSTTSVELEQVLDATLLDRRSARDIFNERQRSLTAKSIGSSGRREERRFFLSWCTVDIGIRSWTFGIGRELIDRRPDGKNDLVLLRLKNGRALLLSPLHAHDLADALSRAMHEIPTDKQRA
mgnify:CR=1 FL=1